MLLRVMTSDWFVCTMALALKLVALVFTNSSRRVAEKIVCAPNSLKFGYPFRAPMITGMPATKLASFTPSPVGVRPVPLVYMAHRLFGSARSTIGMASMLVESVPLVV